MREREIIMKIKLLFFAASIALSLNASAQLRPSTKQACTRKCLNDTTAGGPINLRHEAILKEISQKKAAEKDQDKLKQLDMEEEKENERYAEEHGNSCRRVCHFNPDE